MPIQAIIFNKHRMTKKQSKKWLKDHNFKPIKKVHETKNFYRYRILEPIKGYNYAIKKINDSINFVLFFPD